MNHDGETPQGEMSDMTVSAAYRAAATEISPAELDEKILHAATLEVKSETKPAWTMGWLRPVTFLATAGLSIALLLEFSEMQVFGPPSDMNMGVPESVPGITADSDGNNRDKADFRRAADDAAKQIRAVDAAANATLSEMPGRSCTDTQRASPAEWWLCIGDLQDAGLVAQAKTELQNLRQAYPSFSP